MLTLDSAYTGEKLTHILRKYIDVFKPMWRKNRSLRKIAFDFAKQNLNTPMSIKQFIDNTVDANNKKSLLAGGKNAAEETRISFAREIEEMFRKGLYDRLIFLSFPLIRAVDVETAKASYSEVLERMKKLGYDLIRAKDFNVQIEEFVRVVEIDTKSNWLRYIHPVYEEAFGSTLTCDSKPSDISKKIFSEVLATLSEKNRVSWWIPFSVPNYFDKLPERARTDLLVSLSKKGRVGGVANALTMNFRKASKKEQNLLLKIHETDDAAEQMALLIAYNFDELPVALKNKFLLNFTKRDKTARVLAGGIRGNFGGFSPQMRNRLLLELVKKDQVASILAVVVLEFFEKVPEDVRNKLLLKLSLKDQATRNVARAVADYFDVLPEMLRNELLRGEHNPCPTH